MEKEPSIQDLTRTPQGGQYSPIVISDSPIEETSLDEVQLMEEIDDSLKAKLKRNIKNQGINMVFDMGNKQGTKEKNNRILLNAMKQLGFKYDNQTTVRDIGIFADRLGRMPTPKK
jgi:hypothetical protein